MTPNAAFKARLTARDPLVGCFVKTPHPTVVEVLGMTGLDFLVLDAEHAPFDRTAIDGCLLAARAVAIPVLVRVPNKDASGILNALDCGAAGIVVPHVASVAQAEALVSAVRYRPGGRGIAGTTRAGQYGNRPLADHCRLSADEVTLICQIEDRAGVEASAAIADVAGVDGLFVGRADLSLSCGLDSFSSPEIDAICGEVLETRGCATGLFCAPGEDFGRWSARGASFCVTGSDHSFLISGARALVSAGAAPAKPNGASR